MSAILSLLVIPLVVILESLRYLSTERIPRARKLR